MIFRIIGITILLYSFINFKRSFLIYLCFKALLVTNITLISITGIPLLTLDMFMAIFYIMFFFLHGSRYQNAKMSFPYRRPFILISATWILSTIFSVAGVGAEISNLVGSLSQDILIVWLMWEIIEDKVDFKFLFKGLTIIFLASCIYGIYEFMTQSNPLVLYEATLNSDSSKVIDYAYTSTIRGYRIQSFFEHPIGAGINWAMYAVFVFMLKVKNNQKYSILTLITTMLCILCMILTKMRGPIFFFLIAMFCFIDFRKKQFFKILILLAVAALACWPLLAENSNIILSIFNRSAQSKVGGSDASMRFSQFAAAFALVLQSPIVGLGSKFQSIISNIYTLQLLGMESIWLSVLTKYGLLGVLSYVVQAYYCIVKIPRKFHIKWIGYLTAAYWGTYTLTSIPGMHEYIYYFIIIFCIKNSDVYRSAKAENKKLIVYIDRNFRLHHRKITN